MTPTQTRRTFLKSSAASAAAALTAPLGTACSPSGSQPASQPNIIFILIDDMGWTDLGCFGSKFYETPNIDKLCTRGMKFTNAYAACPVCSPTRASIMTGKYPARMHLTDWINGHVAKEAKLKVPNWTHYMRHDETTIAEALKAGGYTTCHIGKWHLGDDEEYWPPHHGFDINVGGWKAGQPPSYYHPYERDGGWNTSIPTMDAGDDPLYLTDRLSMEACDFIRGHAEGPFFLNLWHYSVHTPIEAKKEYVPHYAENIDPGLSHKNPDYAAMIQSVDESVGRIMDTLDELGITDNTAIIFMSDNGGLRGTAWNPYITSNAPLRGGKGTGYEGGVREPMFVVWPGVTEPGTVSDEVVTSTDFYPTMLTIAGLEQHPEQSADGVDISPVLKGETDTLSREAVYWHYPHYHFTTPYGAVRAGDWKLIEYYEDGRLELYNLADDIAEQHNLAGANTEKRDELKNMLASWRTEVDAQMPGENPDWNGEPYLFRGGNYIR